MQETGWLNFHWCEWSLSVNNIESLDLPASVIEIILERIKHLSEETKNFLSIASIAGVRFSSEKIKIIAQFSDEVNVRAINEATKERLIQKEGKDEFVFVHDRVVEALTEATKQNERELIHHKLSQQMINSASGEQPENIYNLAEHLIAAKALTSDTDLVRWVSLAAEEAINTHLNIEGERYIDIIFEAARRSNLTLNSSIYALAGELYNRIGNFPKSKANYEKAIQLNPDKYEKCYFRLKLLKSYFGSLDLSNPRMNEIFDETFSDLNEWTVKWSPINYLTLITALVLNVLGIWYWWPRKKTSQRILAEAHYLYGLFKYHEADFNLAMLHSWKSYFVANRYGSCLELAKAANQAGIAFGSVGIKFASKYMMNKGRKIADEFVDRRLKAECDFYGALIIDLLGDPVQASKDLKRFLQKRGHYMHPIDYMNAIFAYLWIEGIRGNAKVLIKEFERARSYINNQQGLSYLSLAVFDSQESCVKGIKGNYSKSDSYDIFSEEALKCASENRYVAGCQVQSTLLLKITQEDVQEEEIDALVDHFNKYCHIPPIFTIFIPPAQYFIWRAIAYSQLYLNNPSKVLKSKFKKALFDLFLAGTKHPTYRTYYLYLKSLYYWKNGKRTKSLDLLNKALHYSRVYEVPWVELECYYYRYRLYIELDREENAKQDISAAFYIAKKYGLEFRLRALRVELNIEEDMKSTVHNSSSSTLLIHGKTDSSVVNASWVLHGQKQFDALKSLSINLSPILEIEKQQYVAIKTIMETLGAERGFLYAVEDNSHVRKLILGMDRDGSVYHDDSSISSSVLRTVLDTLEPIVYTGSSESVISNQQSIIAKDIRSIIAAPLILGKKIVGVVYFDNRLIRGAFTKNDIELLTAMANMVAFSLEMAKKAQLEISKKELEKDLEVSGFVQQMIIPEIRDFDNKKYSYSFHFEPVAKAGGDWIWIDEAAEDELALVIGDVTGHGVGSAMITSLVAGVLKCNWSKNRLLINSFQQMHNVLQEVCNSQYGMTCFGAQLNKNTGDITLISSGCPSMFVLRDGECLSWGSGGSIIGFSDFSPSILNEKLLPGDRLVVFTDGIYEAKNIKGNEYGNRRLYRFLLKQPTSQTSQELKTAILTEIKSWAEGVGFDDDLTLFVFDYKATA